jgi:magnesium-protoporphyrin O-methyltransferase
MDGCGCDGQFSVFDRRAAEQDRARYRRSGADRTTRMLLDLLEPYVSPGSTVLDIGGGIGVSDQELLRAGAARAVLVEASPDYLQAARDEARTSGTIDRMRFVEGDFVRQAAVVDPAEIVTLDRVVCCYPDAVSLVGSSARMARTAYGLVFPRDRWFVRAVLRIVNLSYRLRGRAYRAYAHRETTVDRLVADAGLLRRDVRTTLVWRVVVYARAAGTGRPGAIPGQAARDAR